MANGNSQKEKEAEEARKEKTRKEVSNLPAIYVDAYFLTWWRGHIRISIGEHLYEKNHFRYAFVMPLEDAEELAKDLLEAIKKRKEKDAAEKR